MYVAFVSTRHCLPFEMYATHALENLSAPDLDHFRFFAKCAPELATPAKSVPLS